MAMDQMLKAGEQPFVSEPVSFRNYVYFAKKTSEECKKIAPMLEAQNNFARNLGLPLVTGDKVLDLIDIGDIRTQIFNREMDNGLERNRMSSQGILLDEGSRRRNAQYKSIALRALRYDHMDQAVLARKSPYLEDKKKTLRASGSVERKSCEEPSCSTKPVPKFQKKPAKKQGKRASEFLKVLDSKEDDSPDLSIYYKDLIVNVSIYFGYTRELEYHEIRLGRLMKITDRLELTGVHTLVDLKNAFSCPADFAFLEDFSEKNPTVKDFAKTKFPSSMFFIHDTFYIDQHDRAEWDDPSSNIRKWARSRKSIGPMNVALMADTKLGDLTCRLGQPYVFIHQGVCEHLIVFNDLLMRDEAHSNVEFPRRLVERNFRRIACDICKEASAQWMIVDHVDLLPNSPGYLCSTCYKEFCFDVKGKKVGPFKAVPYCDRKEVGDGGKFISELRFEAKKTKKK